MSSLINYDILADAIDYYGQAGYQHINVPWLVNDEAFSVTYPGHLENQYVCPNGTFIGSAEQGFLQLILDDQLAPGYYMASTPCYRNEFSFDDYTHPYFMKVELIYVYPSTSIYCENSECKNIVNKITDDALSFMSRYIDVECHTTDEGRHSRDIVHKTTNIELGSYGYRMYKQDYLKTAHWVYGTGVAEPRFSTVIDKFKPKGYHSRAIPRAHPGTADKLLEEVHEYIDAIRSGNTIMAGVEMADIILNIQRLCEHGPYTFEEVLQMASVTKRAFDSGARK